MYNVTLRSVRANIVVVEKQISITYSECVFVTLGTQHEILSSVVRRAVQYFSTLFHKRHSCRKKKKVIEPKNARFSLQRLPETYLILRITVREMIINVHLSSQKVPVILVRFR